MRTPWIMNSRMISQVWSRFLSGRANHHITHSFCIWYKGKEKSAKIEQNLKNYSTCFRPQLGSSLEPFAKAAFSMVEADLPLYQPRP